MLRRLCGGTDGDGHFFWEFPHPPLVEIREILSFMISLEWIRVIGLGVSCGMGWLE